jgi:hypothetical protein
MRFFRGMDCTEIGCIAAQKSGVEIKILQSRNNRIRHNEKH